MAIEFKPSQFFTAKEVEEFIRSYVGAMLWSTTDEDVYKDGEGPDDCLDARYSIDDLTEETLNDVIEECVKFIDSVQLKIKETKGQGDYANPQWTFMERCGHDFALTRNGHGAGFWDRGLGELGEQLTEACKSYGESCWYVGDDGHIYCI